MNARKSFPLLLLLALTGLPWPFRGAAAAVDPLKLTFHRQAVRRFVFSNNLPLSELVPAEVVAINSMHPAFAPGTKATSDAGARPVIQQGQLILTDPDSTLYVGGVNPYATYELDVQAMEGAAEVAVDLATLGLQKRLQVVSGHKGVALQFWEGGKVVKETVFAKKPLQPPCLLRVQLTGTKLSVFVTKDGETTYLGHTGKDQEFKSFMDFRDRKVAGECTFNVATRIAEGGKVVLGGARAFLSSGVGQADIRIITHKDGAPYWEQNRLWFTFSTRGVLIDQSVQGVMSLDPSLFDLKFEGMILYDHGDGLLRNDYSSHILFDDDTQEWLAIGSDFGGAANRDRRAGSGLVVAHSRHDPRRGFSVLGNARALTLPDETHEDPCLLFDAEAGKWRLLACAMPGFHTVLYESDHWDGPFVPIAGPTREDSTGVLIQKIGDQRYCFSGNKAGPMLVYSYPGLKLLGNLDIDLPAHWPEGPGRGWPNVFPLPAGFPHRYMALMMDRPNFPGVAGPNWSYGALYLFSAYTRDISDEAYEFHR